MLIDREPMIKITDNFLPLDEFETIERSIMSPTFPWFRGNCVDPMTHKVVCDPIYNTLMLHAFYDSSTPFSMSQFVPVVGKLLDRLPIDVLLRVQANYNPRTENHIVHGFHADIEHLDKGLNQYIDTAILYLNTCDGYTYFENGEKVQSVANRLVTFPVEMRHSSSTCTNTEARVLVNLCYIREKNA